MLSPDELRRSVRASKRPISQIAEQSGIAPTTLYSFMSGATGSLRASAHAAVEGTLTGKRSGVSEERTAFGRGGLDLHSSLLDEARKYGIDIEDIARNAVEEAVKAERIRRWNDENREAIDSWNRHYEKHGLWNEKYRLF